MLRCDRLIMVILQVHFSAQSHFREVATLIVDNLKEPSTNLSDVKDRPPDS